MLLWRRRSDPKPTLTEQDGFLLYRTGDVLLDRQPLEALTRVIHVYAGSDLYSTDMDFELLAFGSVVWVVPEIAAYELGPGYQSKVKQAGVGYDLVMDWPPRPWLDGGFLGLMRRPAARVLRSEPLNDPNWIWSALRTHGHAEPFSQAAAGVRAREDGADCERSACRLIR